MHAWIFVFLFAFVGVANAQYHQVKAEPGDSPETIAKKFGFTTKQVCDVNPAEICQKKLRIGQDVNLPVYTLEGTQKRDEETQGLIDEVEGMKVEKARLELQIGDLKEELAGTRITEAVAWTASGAFIGLLALVAGYVYAINRKRLDISLSGDSLKTRTRYSERSFPTFDPTLPSRRKEK